MKTKDKILGQHPVMCDNAGKAVYVSFSSAMAAMDEYAKQQAIEFMKFVDAFYSQNVSDESYDKMYIQFIESQNK